MYQVVTCETKLTSAKNVKGFSWLRARKQNHACSYGATEFVNSSWRNLVNLGATYGNLEGRRVLFVTINDSAPDRRHSAYRIVDSVELVEQHAKMSINLCFMYTWPLAVPYICSGC